MQMTRTATLPRAFLPWFHFSTRQADLAFPDNFTVTKLLMAMAVDI
jgi:hypothetical protein